MEMNQVRYFLAVCETLNFTRAAERCNVAQPSLTRAIKHLEEELGGPLFRRERNRSHLTDLGRLVRPHLEQIAGATRAAREQAEQYRSLDKAPLRLGIMCTVGPARITGFLARLRTELPGVDLHLSESKATVLVEEMLGGAFDVALVALPQLPERLDARTLFDERYVVAFGRGHRFERLNAVPMSALDGQDYLQRTNCEFPEYRRALDAPPAGMPRIVYSSEREDWIQAMLAAGIGCAVMPEYLPMLPGIATRPLIEPEMQRTVSLVTVAGRRFPPPLEALIRIARHHPWGAQA